MFLKPRLFVIVNSLLLLAAVRFAQAAVIKIVSPSAYKDIEGEGGYPPGGAGGPFRGQQVFPAVDFAPLGDKPHWLVNDTFRPDESLTSPLTVLFPDNQFRYATMPVGPPNLSMNFDDNLGSDFKHFYRGPWTLVADVVDPGFGPREFYDSNYSGGVAPYLYDPSQGNLLLDFIGWQGVSLSPRGDEVPGIQSALYGSSPFATQGVRGAAHVHLFTFIPVGETSTWNVDAGGNWSLPANWASSVPNIMGARAVLGSAITAPRTVTINTPITVGRLDFNNANTYTIGGSQILTLDTISGDAQINVASGSHTISAPLRLADNTTITVTPTDSNLSLTGPFVGQNVTKAGAGTLTMNYVRAASLSVDGGTVAIAPVGIPAVTSMVSSLSIAGGAAPIAKLDLTDNGAVINYTGTSPVASMRQQIIAGRGGAGLGKTWNGSGITSSAAAAAAAIEPESRSVAYAENSSMPLGALASFRGQPVDDTSIILAFTRTGDANVDGVVNDNDVTIVGAAYAPGVPQPSWALGDFDYNGFVDDDDVTLLGAFYDPSAAPLGAPLSGAAVATVPEPGSLVLALLAAAGIGIYVVRRRERAFCSESRNHSAFCPQLKSVLPLEKQSWAVSPL